MLSELPPSFTASREGLHRVATHVLARRRHAYTGRIGLRATPGGLGTPAFGDDLEVTRTSGGFLVAERAGIVNRAPLTTLADVAELAGVSLDVDFSVGEATPPVGDPESPLAIDPEAARLIGDWYGFGLQAIDELAATEPLVTAADAPQVWPEHFDLGCIVTVAGDGGLDAGTQVNLGASPGDGAVAEPYLYVGPWADVRPGDPGYWNVPFGAALPFAELAPLPEPQRRAEAVAFLRTGITRLAHAHAARS